MGTQIELTQFLQHFTLSLSTQMNESSQHPKLEYGRLLGAKQTVPTAAPK